MMNYKLMDLNRISKPKESSFEGTYCACLVRMSDYMYLGFVSVWD
jgi:hypothetical protein